MTTAALVVDSQCTLGEGLVWDGRRLVGGGLPVHFSRLRGLA